MRKGLNDIEKKDKKRK